MQKVLERILEKFKPGSIQGIEILYSDNSLRICHPIACTRLADHSEKMAFLGLSMNGCSYCEVPPDGLGEYEEEYPMGDHVKYRQIIRDGNLGNLRLDEKERDQRMKQITRDTGLRLFPLGILKLEGVSSHEIFAPDVLHWIWIGVFSHLIGWIMGFLKKNEQLDLFHQAWLVCTEYPNFRKPNKIFSAMKKWTGFENRSAGRILLPCLAVALKDLEPGQAQEFRMALTCVCNFVDFSILCHFRFHTNYTIGYMRRHLEEFHEAKVVFLEFRAHKKTKAEAAEIGSPVRTEIANLDGPSRQRAITATQIRDQVKEAERDALREDSDFTFPKIHFLEHLPDQISAFGHLG